MYGILKWTVPDPEVDQTKLGR